MTKKCKWLSLFIFVVLKATFLAQPGFAKDVASIEFLGFSDSGEAVFLQKGRQDGSGFPYAILSSSIGTKTIELDAVVLETSAATEEDAIAELSLQSVSQDLQPGSLLLLRVHTDLGSFEEDFEIHTSNHYQPDHQALKLTLSSLAIEAGASCYGLYSQEVNFALSLSHGDTSEGQPTRIDLKPENCTQSARIGAVFSHEPFVDTNRIAVFVMVEIPGFEGTKLRWIGITHEF